jgi:hypothetical protein
MSRFRPFLGIASLSLALTILVAPVSSAETRSDEELYDAFASLAMAGDGPGALAFAQELMAQGNINGRRFMIALYFNGVGVEEDTVRGFELMYEAAEDGDPMVQFELGLLYADGDRVEQSDERSAHWMRQAAEAGDADAQHTLSRYLANGKGVAQDLHEAILWSSRAKDQGHRAAEAYLIELTLGAMIVGGQQAARESTGQDWVNTLADLEASGAITLDRTQVSSQIYEAVAVSGFDQNNSQLLVWVPNTHLRGESIEITINLRSPAVTEGRYVIDEFDVRSWAARPEGAASARIKYAREGAEPGQPEFFDKNLGGELTVSRIDGGRVTARFALMGENEAGESVSLSGAINGVMPISIAAEKR